MAEVIGLVASLVTLIDTSKTSLRIARNIYRAPKELKALEDQLQAFVSVIRDVEALGERATDNATLEVPLTRAREILLDVQSLIEYELMSPDPNDRKVRRKSYASKKFKVREAKEHLADCRANLVAAVALVTSSSALRNEDATLTLTEAVERTEIGTNHIERGLKQLDHSIRDAEDGRLAADAERWRYLSEHFFEQNSHNSQVQQFLSMLSSRLGLPKRRSSSSHFSNSASSSQRSGYSEWSFVSSRAAEAIEDDEKTAGFWDCVSTVSAVDALAYLGGIVAPSPSGSSFEASMSFFPESYTTESRLDERICVFSMSQHRWAKDYRVDRYLFLYAETPRRWQRVTAEIIVDRKSDHYALTQVNASDATDSASKNLPTLLQSPLEDLLKGLKFKEGVTKVELRLQTTAIDKTAFDSSSVGVSVDEDEIRADVVDELLMAAEDLGCPQFLEEEIVTHSRLRSSSYCVSTGSTLCLHRVLPFSSGSASDAAIQSFMYELKVLSCLRGSKSIVPFVGIVVDQRRQQLKGFLSKIGSSGPIAYILRNASQRGETVSWARREKWARGIIQGVAEVHEKGFTVGSMISLETIAVDEHDHAKLMVFRPPHTHDKRRGGILAPELRKTSERSSIWATTWNARCDLFQLGLLLWLLAQDFRWKFEGLFCDLAACSGSKLSHRCMEPHSDPIGLPWGPGSALVLSYYRQIIAICRSESPRDRLPATTLLRLFPSELSYLPKPKPLSPRHSLENAYAYGFTLHCDICGNWAMEKHFHCYTCSDGNFDICEKCVLDGFHCKDEEHVLVKRMSKNGKIVNTPDYGFFRKRIAATPATTEVTLTECLKPSVAVPEAKLNSLVKTQSMESQLFQLEI